MTREEFKAQAMKKASSKFNQYDKNKDGVLSKEEATRAQILIDLENKDKKEDQLRRMAWIAMGSMIIFTVLMFLPIFSDERIKVLEAILQTFYLAQAGVVATFFGANAYMSRHTTPTQTEP